MKKKVKKVLGFLDLGISPGTVLFSCGFTYKELTTLLDKNYKSGRWPLHKGVASWYLGISQEEELLGKGGNFGMSRTIEHPKHGEVKLYYILLTKEFDFSDDSMAILAHEILHIIQFHLPDILNRNKEIEAEAYTHTHLMNQCLKLLREK